MVNVAAKRQPGFASISKKYSQHLLSKISVGPMQNFEKVNVQDSEKNPKSCLLVLFFYRLVFSPR